MGLRGYLYLAGLVALALSHLWMYGHGKAVCQAEATRAALDAKDAENETIKRTMKKIEQLADQSTDRLKTIKEATDACLDTRLPESLAQRLRDDGPSR